MNPTLTIIIAIGIVLSIYWLMRRGVIGKDGKVIIDAKKEKETK